MTLIEFEKIKSILTENNIKVKSILHVGAHECEELNAYKEYLNVSQEDIIWIDGIREKVRHAKKRNIPNVYQAVISDEDGKNVNFNITNNFQSSSIFELGTHKQEHPHVKVMKTVTRITTTLENFFKNNNLDPSKCNMWCFDIQGAELLALKGGKNLLCNVDVLYLEVNEKELYVGCANVSEIDCFLKNYGFERVETFMTNHGWGDAIYIRK
jgi:hypothetical protein